MTTLRFAEKLRDLVGGVDVVLSDIWGVVHNGLVSFPEACEALHNFRTQGGTVILITNAPRPADSVQRQLRKLGVADETYDASARAISPGISSPTTPAGKCSGSARSATIRSTAASIRRSRRWSRPITSSAPACSTTKPNPPKTIAR
jgi:hypothetical protein